MNDTNRAAIALEEALRELLGVFHDEATAPEAMARVHDRCSELTTRLVAATSASTPAELEDAAPALRRAQRLNAIARGIVERQRGIAGTLIAGVQRARRAIGADAPIPDGTSCDLKA